MKKPVFKTGRQAMALPASLRSVRSISASINFPPSAPWARTVSASFPLQGHLALQLDIPSAVKAITCCTRPARHLRDYALGEDDKEERIVGAFATAWAQVFRDNPWLLEWLQRALR